MANDRVKYKVVGDGYEAILPLTYYSVRYKKSVTVPSGFFSDGATDAIDIDSDCWWFHDVLCRYGKFDDGTKVKNWQASTILYDIMIRDGFWFRAPWWRAATFMFGGGQCRKNFKRLDIRKPIASLVLMALVLTSFLVLSCFVATYFDFGTVKSVIEKTAKPVSVSDNEMMKYKNEYEKRAKENK